MILALLFVAPPQTAPAPVTIERVVVEVSKCGLGPAKSRYDETLQDALVVVRQKPRATDRQLACVDVAANSYEVELNPILQSRFEAIRTARLAALFKARAREWLAKQDLLARLPEYHPGKTDDAAFDRSLEQLCGPDAAGAPQSPKGPHVLNIEWAERQDPAKVNQGAFGCILNAMAASDVLFGIIGNEATTP
jgi:hypothetical protein